MVKLKEYNAFTEQYFPSDWDEEDYQFLADFLADQTEYRLYKDEGSGQDYTHRLFKRKECDCGVDE